MMQNKFIFNTVKCFLYGCIIILAISFSNIFNGCSGSEEEEIVDQRSKDSIQVYTNLQKSFGYYKKALEYNESGNDQKASESFEAALKSIDEVSYDIIAGAGNFLWRKDYEELTKAIVQDFLITQKEISESSLVFNYAKRVPVTYEKIEIVKGDREPLPDGSDIPLIRNSAVDEYIDFFSKTERGRTFIDKCLYRSGKFFPLMRKILKFNNAPEELIYLSVQESGLNPTIISRAGAVGLWQFMPATGSAYGLGQDEYRDDRRDFEKSTDAAARHLKDLYKT
ncbi:MAG: lytic transglycosylase domain-containing protein, partial [bacterium]